MKFTRRGSENLRNQIQSSLFVIMVGLGWILVLQTFIKDNLKFGEPFSTIAQLLPLIGYLMIIIGIISIIGNLYFAFNRRRMKVPEQIHNSNDSQSSDSLSDFQENNQNK